MSHRLESGINLNSHPQTASIGHPLPGSTLNGVQWARLVFNFHAAVDLNDRSINLFGYDFNRALEYEDSLPRAFAHYDTLVNSYAEAGIRTLMILNQETFAGNAPWFPGSDGDWNRYSQDFATFCGRVVAHYRGKKLAYEIWNEGDIEGMSSVFVPADKFAPILNRASQAIKAADPDAPVIFGGLASAAGNGVRYVNDVCNALGGVLPVDGIGIHPYLQKLRSEQPPFTKEWGGFLHEAIQTYIDGLPGQKFWMTEIGVAPPAPLPAELQPGVAQFMDGVFDLVRREFIESVPVVIWFAWSDIMHEAGIVDRSGNPKQPMFDTFFSIIRAEPDHDHVHEEEPAERVETPEERLVLVPVEGLRIRSEGVLDDGNILGTVSQGMPLEAVDDQAALAKLGQQDEWIRVRADYEGFAAAWLMRRFNGDATPVPVPAGQVVLLPTIVLRIRREGVIADDNILGTVSENMPLVPVDEQEALAKLGVENEWIRVRVNYEGFAAAWLLSRFPASDGSHVDSGDVPDPSDLVAGQQRAFDLNHDPVFVRLPVINPAAIGSFSGFGPNNFSYRTFRDERRASGSETGGFYAALGGLHNGMDFGMAQGTMLAAMDWGVVVHVSAAVNDTPFRAGPFTVIVRYGKLLVLYGHMQSVAGMRVQAGQMVKPGDEIGLSGISNGFAHLHFEMRDLNLSRLQQKAAQAGLDVNTFLTRILSDGTWFSFVPNFVNPARFFAPALNPAVWARAQSLPDVDNDGNGYPDRVVRAGAAAPVAYDIFSVPLFQRGGMPHFWENSFEV